MPELRIVSAPKDAHRERMTALVGGLRSHFETGATKPLSWRLSQLQALEHFFMEREQDIMEALRQDLGKPATEAFISEVGVALSELRSTRKKLGSWMKPQRVRTTKVAMPGRSYIYREPLGVTLIIGAWNYPLQLVTVPMIGAIAAGNCVVLKPSEVAPNVAALLSYWLP
jgi:aldehyde dehydrogenase (NAD+)